MNKNDSEFKGPWGRNQMAGGNQNLTQLYVPLEKKDITAVIFYSKLFTPKHFPRIHSPLKPIVTLPLKMITFFIQIKGLKMVNYWT